MSSITDLPNDILEEIFALLPVKSIVALTYVCKSFKTLITSSRFFQLHYERNPPMRNASDHLLVRTTEIDRMSCICARTFARVLDIQLPANVVHAFGNELTVYGSYDGLLCISARFLDVDSPIYLWNPSIRRIRRLPTGLIQATYDTQLNSCNDRVTLGFGFNSAGGNDYKVIKFVHHVTDSVNTFQAEVYSLNSNSWNRITTEPTFPEDYCFLPKCAYLNGVVYWLLSDVSSTDDHMNLFSFDLQHELITIWESSRDFSPLMRPNYMQVWNNSLSFFRVTYVGGIRRCHVVFCNMEMRRLILYMTVIINDRSSVPWPLGFNRSGSGRNIEVVIERNTEGARLISLVTEGAGIELGMFEYCWYVDVYRESLLLLD